MRILLTAFDPFWGEKTNPAQEAVRLVTGRIAGVEIIKLSVPTVFGRSIDVVTEAIRHVRPHAVVCVGQAGGRTAITPERVAINMEDASIPDNEGYAPMDKPVIPGAPAAYFSTLPIKAMVKAVKDIGLPASVSNTAGTFVCNHLMYGVMHLLGNEFPGTLGGFIHVPYLLEQAAQKAEPAFGMPLEDIVRGLEAALAAVAEALAQNETELSKCSLQP
jgi:pyroglutamyl-peptidase